MRSASSGSAPRITSKNSSSVLLLRSMRSAKRSASSVSLTDPLLYLMSPSRSSSLSSSSAAGIDTPRALLTSLILTDPRDLWSS